MIRHVLRVIPLLVLLGVMACAPALPPTPSPTPQILLWDGSATQTLSQTDAGYQEIIAAWQTLLQAVSAQARTMYTPDRFRQEIASHPYVQFDYPVTTTLQGKGFSFEAASVVVTVAEGELLVLGRRSGEEDWSVYLPASEEAGRQFLQAVEQATGLKPGS